MQNRVEQLEQVLVASANAAPTLSGRELVESMRDRAPEACRFLLSRHSVYILEGPASELTEKLKIIIRRQRRIMERKKRADTVLGEATLDDTVIEENPS